MLEVGNKGIVDISKGDTYFNSLYLGDNLLWKYDKGKEEDVIYYTTNDNTPIEDSEFYEGTGVEVLENKLDIRSGKFKVTFKDTVTKFNNNFLNGVYSSSTGNEEEPYFINNTPVMPLPVDDFNLISIYAYKLTSIEFKNFNHCTSIGSQFINSHVSCKHVDLSGLSNVKEIGYMFFQSNYIEEIDLTPLSGVEKIDSYFLGGSTYMTKLDTTPLSNIKELPSCFLYSCRYLTELDLNGLSNVTSIGGNFLRDCRTLKVLDLSPLKKVTYVEGIAYLMGCDSLETIIIDIPDKIMSVLLEKIETLPSLQSIFVPDELVAEYKIAVPDFEIYIKPLSEYNP